MLPESLLFPRFVVSRFLQTQTHILKIIHEKIYIFYETRQRMLLAQLYALFVSLSLYNTGGEYKERMR